MTAFRLFFWVFIICLLVHPSSANAFKCAPTKFNVDAFDIVFEGHLLGKRYLDDEEKELLDLRKYSDFYALKYEVVRPWKGVSKGDFIETVEWQHYEDEYEKMKTGTDEILFVFASKIYGAYFTPKCIDASNLSALRLDRYGEGDDYKVMGEDMICEKDADCTTIVTHCGECSCGTPVSKSALDKYTQIKNEVCSGYEGPTCDKDCPALEMMCDHNKRCRLKPLNPASNNYIPDPYQE